MPANIIFQIENREINCLIGLAGDIEAITVDGVLAMTGEANDFAVANDEIICQTVFDRLEQEKAYGSHPLWQELGG